MNMRYKAGVLFFLLLAQSSCAHMSFMEYLFYPATTKKVTRTVCYTAVLGLCAWVWHKGVQLRAKECARKLKEQRKDGYYIFARNKEEYENLNKVLLDWQNNCNDSILFTHYSLSYMSRVIFNKYDEESDCLQELNKKIKTSGFRSLGAKEFENRIQTLYEKDQEIVKQQNKERRLKGDKKLLANRYELEAISPYLYVKKGLKV